MRFNIGGIFLRQIWTWMCVLLVAAFGSAIKSILIKQPEKTYISQVHELVDAGLPVYVVAASEELFEALYYSPFSLDRWLYENAREVLIYENQYFTHIYSYVF